MFSVHVTALSIRRIPLLFIFLILRNSFAASREAFFVLFVSFVVIIFFIKNSRTSGAFVCICVSGLQPCGEHLLFEATLRQELFF